MRMLTGCKILLVAAVLVIVSVFATHPAHAAATIVVQNNDGPGEGFNDPTPFTPVGGNNATTLGAARLNCFQEAADIWGACINSGVTIVISAQFDPLDCDAGGGTLGRAGPETFFRDFTNAPQGNTWYAVALANALAGSDLDPGVQDINATFNSDIDGNNDCLFNTNWYYGLDANPPANGVDLVTVLLHEFAHGLGFLTGVDLGTGELLDGRLDTYTLNMEQHGASPDLYQNMNDAERLAGNTSDPDLHWIGANVLTEAANIPLTGGFPGGHVRLHGPATPDPGSSLSHFSTALTPSDLMEPSYTGPLHDIGLARELFMDIGWTVDMPPTITCPGDITVECTDPGGAPASNAAIAAFLAGAMATDDTDPSPAITTDAPAFFPLGSTVVTFTATDVCFNTDECTATVTVEDNTAPDVTCPGNITVECSDFCGTPADDEQLTDFFNTFAATDACDSDLQTTLDNPSCFPMGTTTVTFTATDDSGNRDSCTVDVTVEDTTPPEITVELNRESLWPPNHKMADICATVMVTDICDPNPTFVLTSVESDEPDNGRGDGNTVNDIQGAATGTPDVKFQLRSERQGGGDGRKYTIIYTASDESGNTTPDTSCVVVPHDQSGMALASSGYTIDGTAFEDGAESFVVVIPSLRAGTLIGSYGGEAFDATALDPQRVYVGNTFGALRPTSSSAIDVNQDGLEDLALYYSVGDTRAIVEGSLETSNGAANRHSHGPVGIQYAGIDGEYYRISDIFDLGERVDLFPFIIPSVGDQDTDEPERAPQTTKLASVYPNPFNPTTTITFALAEGAQVDLRIYDARGTLVRTLKQESLGIGRYSVVWDGRDGGGRQVATGVYFVRLVAGSYEMTKKIVMIK